MKDILNFLFVFTLTEGIVGFLVSCDAPRIGWRCVLMQNGKVISYISRKHKVHEINYPTHDIKLAAIAFAFKISRHYLYSVRVDAHRP